MPFKHLGFPHTRGFGAFLLPWFSLPVSIYAWKICHVKYLLSIILWTLEGMLHSQERSDCLSQFLWRHTDIVFQYCIVPIKKDYAANRIQAYLNNQNKTLLILFCWFFFFSSVCYSHWLTWPHGQDSVLWQQPPLMRASLFLCRCLCVTGYTGLNCEVNINECDSSPCLNQATCVDALNSYVCKCPPGFTGSRCETGTQDQASELRWHD